MEVETGLIPRSSTLVEQESSFQPSPLPPRSCERNRLSFLYVWKDGGLLKLRLMQSWPFEHIQSSPDHSLCEFRILHVCIHLDNLNLLFQPSAELLDKDGILFRVISRTAR